MRSYEFITETTQADQALWATARDILKPLVRDAKRGGGPEIDRYVNGGQVGTLGQLSKNTPPEIADVILMYAPGDVSEYYAANSTSNTRDVIKDYNPGNRYIALGGTSYEPEDYEVKEMISVLAHEMRHALDDSLSGGKFKGSHGRGATRYRGQNQIKDLPYGKRPLELNAMYTQAIGEILPAVKATTNNKRLKDIIVKAFRNNPDLLRAYPKTIDDPNFRRLFNRAWLTASERREQLKAGNK
jgi:hypothetical protein